MPKSRVRQKTTRRNAFAARRQNEIRAQINGLKRYILHGAAMRATGGKPAMARYDADGKAIHVRTLDHVDADPRDQQFVKPEQTPRVVPPAFTITKIADDTEAATEAA